MSSKNRNKAAPRVPGEATATETPAAPPAETQAQTTEAGASDTMGTGLDLDGVGEESTDLQQGDTIETVHVESDVSIPPGAESSEVALLRAQLAEANARAEAAEAANVQGSTSAGESNIDEAIALAQAGLARPIGSTRAPVAPAVVSRPDEMRTPRAAVNQKAQMSYAEAMKLHAAGTLTRSVLTEKGWVAAPVKNAEHIKR